MGFSDIERKMLRIIFNCSLHGKKPTIENLSKWTGREKENIYPVLFTLNEKGCIKWSKNKPNDITFISQKGRMF